MPENRWTDALRARLEADRRRGLSLQELADRHHVTRERIRQILSRIAHRRALGLPYQSTKSNTRSSSGGAKSKGPSS